MKLSIIIVNYNVRYFLELCLQSVYRACKDIESEVIVVDNNSSDHSEEAIASLFPQVKWIANKSNTGFAKANNIGIKQAQGKYILLLNPDTIVPENGFEECIRIMEQKPKIGALGIRMIDGSGTLLPESKRGFPSVWVAFCKFLGLAKLAPQSAAFNYYYMGHLPYDQSHEVEVLSGAFMMLREDLLQTLEGFDESYFMYGEDIDLSHRVRLAGYQNYYLADPPIIHFKGESTKKGNLNYTKTFHQAMMIFAKKYIAGSSKWMMIAFLQISIVIKAFFHFINTVLKTYGRILLDTIVVAASFYFIKGLWSEYYFGTPFYYPSSVVRVLSVFYFVIYIFSFYLFGLYDKWVGIRNLILSALFGFAIQLALYALLPSSLRYSRMIILLNFSFVFLYLMLSRLSMSKFFGFIKSISLKKEPIFCGDENEFQTVQQQATLLGSKLESIRYKSLTEALKDPSKQQIIFGSKQESYYKLIQAMSQHAGRKYFRFLSLDQQQLVGSDSKDEAGEIQTLLLTDHLSQDYYQRQKRVFDILFALLLLVLFPLLIFLQQNKIRFISNIISVLRSKKTWVGYLCQVENTRPCKSSVLNENHYLVNYNFQLQKDFIHHYSKHYSVFMDMEICLRCLDQLS
ncbi:MAG TPA: glycosyltransferase [Saprospiraceae bacterium]|nr:glycosyltransferase [Saprospiraceae bacterium]